MNIRYQYYYGVKWQIDFYVIRRAIFLRRSHDTLWWHVLLLVSTYSLENSRNQSPRDFKLSTGKALTRKLNWFHYNDVIMGTTASQVTSLTIVYSIVYSDADQRTHQSSASLAFVRGIHRGPVNSPHKWPVTRKMFPFDDVIMFFSYSSKLSMILAYASI